MGCVWNTSCISNVKFLKEVELLQMEAGWEQRATALVHGSSFLGFLVFTMLGLSRINSTLPSLLQEGETLKP